MALYKLATGGVIRTTDGAFIPNDPENSDWAAYEEWLAVPNTADPVPIPSLASYKAAAVANAKSNAEGRCAVEYPVRSYEALLFAESWVAAPDVSPTSGEYPLHDARASAESETLATIIATVAGERSAAHTAWGTVYEALLVGIVAINAATTNAEVDTAVAAIAWP